MKTNPSKKQMERNERIYALYKKGAYTMKGLGNLFRISGPRVHEIIKTIKKREK